MRLEHYSVEKLKKEILAIINRHLDGSKYRVFFFGSRVFNKGTDRSDIDIGIEGGLPVPSKTLFDIQEEVDEIPTLYKIEIVDFGRVPKKFREVAHRHKELISSA